MILRLNRSEYLSGRPGRSLEVLLLRNKGGRDSTPVRGVPYEPIALLRVHRANIESNRWSCEDRGRVERISGSRQGL
jgi:hypothetical protein